MGARYAWLRLNFICRRRRWHGGTIVRRGDEERVAGILPGSVVALNFLVAGQPAGRRSHQLVGWCSVVSLSAKSVRRMVPFSSGRSRATSTGAMRYREFAMLLYRSGADSAPVCYTEISFYDTI